MRFGLLLASVGCLGIGLPSCANLRTGDADSAPAPGSPAGVGVGFGYLRDGRDWYQLRVELEVTEKNWEEGSLHQIGLASVVRLWRYDRRSKGYDHPVPGGAAAKLGLAIDFDGLPRGEPRILPTDGTERGGQSGLDDIRLGVAIDYVKAPDPTAPGANVLIVSALAEAIPADIGERQLTGALAKAKAIRRWQVGIERSGKVRLEEILEPREPVVLNPPDVLPATD
ncbi:MAG: hypothetical protein ACR2RV_04010 [Verrucomicrobiales bacterium]